MDRGVKLGSFVSAYPFISRAGIPIALTIETNKSVNSIQPTEPAEISASNPPLLPT